MNAELLSVGTELLLGEILNTDAQFLAEELSLLGINVYYQTVVGDNRTRLKQALELALERADIVIASGGLGPTPDDLTKEVIAECMGEQLALHEESLANIIAYHQKIGKRMPQSNKKQALLPEHGIVLPNHNGTAPGCIIEKNGKIVVMLPGPPNELKPMFLESVKPFLMKKSDDVLYSETLKIFGIGESKVAELLQDIMENSKNPTLAPYAETCGMRLRLTAKCRDAEEGRTLVLPVKEKIKGIIGKYIYCEEEKGLPEVVVRMLLERKLTISAAESCTGGMFCKMITDMAGVSAILNESFVTYANTAKMNYLGVKAETLEQFGAVSEQTAREMAQGVCKATGADVGVGITGIAGPDGGTEEKPVGLVYVGVCVGGHVSVQELRLVGNRDKIRYSACLYAFDCIRQKLISNNT
ncbi:MAG TPA: competence/damage-inducible protein A [Candidatus Avimonoglobus intestinipullorum]|uniref:Putative competence-damage inducible protein n=1 Tax=Candidatus Avimonoglobus intestinipullorum TaxID=2840699 RepID=A0A9D1LVH3_9FIRM|nr:competence/damage-inducible protein A [Candidatus Avimonoglobus intestinipullorum]